MPRLILGDLPGAEALYRQALSTTESPRAVQSMYSHAVRAAERVHGESGALRMERVFGFDAAGGSAAGTSAP